MAGQGIQRREMLSILSRAAVAAGFQGFTRWSFACGHVGNAKSQIKPSAYAPQFFTGSEYSIVERLTEMIIPNDGTPGAKDAGVAEFIDFMVASDPEVQYQFRTGITWLNAHSARLHGKPFTKLAAEQQTVLLEPLGFNDKARLGEEDGQRFFRLMREYTVMGFYTSEIGFKELDNPALKFYAESPSCPHKGDPEHRNLSSNSERFFITES